MIVFRLVRIASLEEGTFGALKDNHGVPFAVTLEPMWRDNRTNVSCIAGDRQYMCSRTLSPTFGETFKVNRVTGRTNILFHKGNVAELDNTDTHGCILIGEQYGCLNGVPAILQSGKGFDEFMDKLEGEDRFYLDIVNHD